MNHFLLVAAGGALGAALRHGVGLLSLRHLPASWPWATFTVNVLGGFAMGMLVGWLALKAESAGQDLRLFLATGLLGGFTTFSAFSLDSFTLWERGDITTALAYVAGTVILSLGALAAGIYLSREIFA